MKTLIGDWEKSGLYYVVTEQLARMSLVIIQKTENVHNAFVDLTKDISRQNALSVGYFFPSIIRYCNREKEPKRIYLIAGKLRIKQMRLAPAGLENKAIIYTLSLLEEDFQAKKWLQGKDRIKSFAT